MSFLAIPLNYCLILGLSLRLVMLEQNQAASSKMIERWKEMQPWIDWSIQRKQKELSARLQQLAPQGDEQNTAALLHDFQRAWLTLSQPHLSWDLNLPNQLLRCAQSLGQKLHEHQGLAPLINVFFDASVTIPGQKPIELAQALEQWMRADKREAIQEAIAEFLQARKYILDGVVERYSSWQHTAVSLYKGALQLATQLAAQAQSAVGK
jgi:hypothetical protein